MRISTARVALLALACIAPVACDKPAPVTPTLPVGLVTTGAAAGTPVVQCKESAKQGETVTVVGRIGGSKQPFNEQRAVFTIVDASLKACSDAEDDHCKTPWDYCCEDRDDLKRATATVEIVGENGKPLAWSVKGMSGLEPLATIAVTGTVVEKNDAGVMVVRAQKIEVR